MGQTLSSVASEMACAIQHGLTLKSRRWRDGFKQVRLQDSCDTASLVF